MQQPLHVVYIATSISLYDDPLYVDIVRIVQERYPTSRLLFAKGMYRNSKDWLAKWPKVLPRIDELVFFSHHGYIGRGVWSEMQDVLTMGKPVHFYSLNKRVWHDNITPTGGTCPIKFERDIKNWVCYALVIEP